LAETAPKPWERQDYESSKAYEAFACYRDMGPERSLSGLGKQLGKSKALMERWSSNYHWQERIASYERELENQALADKKKTAAETRKRQLQIAMQLEKRALEALKNIQPEDLTPKDVKEFLRLATDIETRVISDTEAGYVNGGDGRASLAETIIAAYTRRAGNGNES